MIVIFSFSAKTAVQSGQESSRLVEFIMNIVFRDLDSWDVAYRLSVANVLEIILRKTAHATEFALLYCLLFLGLYKGRFVKSVGSGILFSIVISFLYACSDEIHQLFVPGRSGQVTDVMIDTLGACIAALMLYCIMKIRLRIRSSAK